MEEKDYVRERLLQYINYIGSKPARFERECGLSNGYIRNIRDTISYKKMQQILKVHKDLSEEWLMNGKGEMLVSDDSKKEEKTISLDNGEYWKAKYEECFAEGLRMALGLSKNAN